MRKKNIIISILTILAIISAGFFLFFSVSDEKQPLFNKTSVCETMKNYYVDPDGSDANKGLSPKAPLATIQKALDLAEPCSTINLSPGTYLQDFQSRRDGSEGNPIVITGPSSAIVKGAGKPRVIEINHDYITLENFSVDGLSGDPEKKSSYRDKLIYVQGKDDRSGVTGLKMIDMHIRNAGGECVRLRYFAQKNEISGNKITNCGAYDFRLGGKGKNGEGIYVGTAPEQRDDGKNPTDGTDHSDGNWIHDNTIDTQGNECVDIKEGSSGNIVENNTCTGQKDEDSGGLCSRGSKNIFRNNTSYGNAGSGIRLGGDKKDDGISNDVYGNIIKENARGGIRVMRYPQGKICGNEFIDNGDEDFTGSYEEKFKATDC